MDEHFDERFREIAFFFTTSNDRDAAELTLKQFCSLLDEEANILIKRVENFKMKGELRELRGTICCCGVLCF